MELSIPRWPPFLGYLRDRRRRALSDRAAAARANWRNFEAGLPPGLELQWLGTAGFRISYRGVHLLIDPYLSRASLATLARWQPLTPSPDLVERHVPAADAVLVGHTHFDHAVDAPQIARRHGCPVYGSRSLRRLMELHDLGDRAVEVAPYRDYDVGPFRITFVPSRHSRLLLGLAVPYDGELACTRLGQLTHTAYRSGQVFAIHISVAGVSFYHQGSADLVDEAIHHRGVDYFLACIAGRGFTARFWPRILGRLQPRVVVPHHFDDFFQPLGGQAAFSFNVNFAGFLDELRAASRDMPVRCLEPLQTVGTPCARS
jgi:L-ascorbate metabolism protein UlaG (beta-lactamase superfamily)